MPGPTPGTGDRAGGRSPATAAEEDEIDASAQVPSRSWPTATYRVQLHADFTFDDAAALAPYLAALGISHLYCSPVLQAAPGSTHGYDIVDHGRLNEELGGAAGFDRMVRALDRHGLAVIIDTVPNHMALAGRANRWWWDVLEDGPASRYARHFDIDWTSSGPGSGSSVLVPILADDLGHVVEAGNLALLRRGGMLVVGYHDHELPLAPGSAADLLAAAAALSGSEDLAEIARELGALPPATRAAPATVDARQRGKADLARRLAALAQIDPAVDAAIDAELAAVAADPGALHELLGEQSYRLAHWRTADSELDYRRFFSITTLAALRVEDEVVFDDTHRLLAELIGTGRVAGLRVDHIDGLRDPAEYLQRLRALAPDAYVVVEKILQRGEVLPGAWPVEGTSGYDHLTAVDGLFVDPDGEAAMTELYVASTGGESDFHEVEHDSKLHVMAHELAAETERATTLLVGVCAGRSDHRDRTRRELRDALREVVAGMRIYRTYLVEAEEPSRADRDQVDAAVASAAARRPDIDRGLLDLLRRVLLLEVPGDAAAELAVRFQQLTAPVMAKGVEDTAFYRYGRLVSLNEVGGDPATFGRSVAEFHRHAAHLAQHHPGTMLTLSTHDTKRSADVRARIHLLSELPSAWRHAVQRWATANEHHRRQGAPDRETELLLYQTLVGAWPIEAHRVVAAMVKSAKEAKVQTSWAAPDQAYDAAVESFVTAVMADGLFGADLEAFLAEHRIVELGRATSLAQTVLLLTSPGVPDLYQGTELWDLSLVDPDNRRPVDHDLRRRMLDELRDADADSALDHLDDGGVKLWVIGKVLGHRRRHPGLFQGTTYEPISARGAKARHVVAFARDGLTVVVPRLLVGLAGDWGDTTVAVPPGSWVDVLTGGRLEGGDHEAERLLGRFPAAVLVNEATT